VILRNKIGVVYILHEKDDACSLREHSCVPSVRWVGMGGAFCPELRYRINFRLL